MNFFQKTALIRSDMCHHHIPRLQHVKSCLTFNMWEPESGQMENPQKVSYRWDSATSSWHKWWNHWMHDHLLWKVQLAGNLMMGTICKRLIIYVMSEFLPFKCPVLPNDMLTMLCSFESVLCVLVGTFSEVYLHINYWLQIPFFFFTVLCQREKQLRDK